jgi:PAS domain-containing protein
VVKLLDFGLARSGRPITTAGIEGTPEYLAPERIYGEPASTRSDIYALGVLFYEVLVGHRPYVGEVEDVFKMHCQAEIPRPSTKLDEPLDERADEIIARAMAKDPDDRHQDVAGFMFELRTFMSMLGMNVGRRRTGATGQHARRARTSPGDRRRQRLAVDIFENAPVPLAAVDAQTRVRAANRAFLEFLGVATDAVGIQLANSALADVYPELCADLDEARATREIVKRVIRLEGVGGVEVDVAVLLRPAGDGDSDIILALHPLRRGGSDGSPSRSPVS